MDRLTLGLVVFLSALVSLTSSSSTKHRTVFHNALANFGKDQQLIDSAFRNLGVSPRLYGRAKTLQHGLVDDSEDCTGCISAIDLLYAAIDLGLEYEDLRDVIIDLCEDTLNSTGSRGDIICTPVIDYYGPEVTEILKRKVADGEQVCIGLNICDPDAQETELVMPKGKDEEESAPNTSNKKSEIGLRIAHIADIHIEEAYIEGTLTDCGLPVCCRGEGSGNGTASKWGEYTCNTPPRTVELFLQKIKDLNPDFIIYTGDNPPHAQWTESRESQLAASRWVARAMDRILSDFQVFPNIGNHEAHPTNLYFLERELTQELNQEFAFMWRNLAKFSPAEIITIEEKGYYQMEVRQGLRIIAYNTNFGYVGNFYTLLDKNDEELVAMAAWMEQTLADARVAGEKVILSGHHPAGRFDISPLHGQTISDLCVRYSDIIVLHVAGHTHKDEFVLFTNQETSEAVGVQHVASAATGYSYVNPSLRVYNLDADTFQLQNYEQYVMDLTKAAETEVDPEIEFTYSPLDEYKMPDVTPGSYATLADRFEDDEGLFDKYLSNRFTGNSYLIDTCDAECRKEELCEVRFSSWDRVRACLRN